MHEPQPTTESPNHSPDEQQSVALALSPEEKDILARLPVEVQEETIEELKRIARVVGGDYDMTVTLGEPGKGSFFDHETGHITLDPLFIAQDPSGARMVSAHEGAHRRLSRDPRALGLKPELIAQLFGARAGFSYIDNAVEDPAVNTWTMRTYDGLRADFQKTYTDMLEKPHQALGLDHPEVKDLIRRTGTIPNLVWVGSEIIRYWHTRRFSKDIKRVRPEATKALAKVLRAAMRAYNTIPESTTTDAEILGIARDRFLIIYQEIWPHLAPLIEEDRQKEAERQMVQEKQKKKDASDAGADAGAGADAPSDLSDALASELAEAIKKAAAQAGAALDEQVAQLAQEAVALADEAKKLAEAPPTDDPTEQAKRDTAQQIHDEKQRNHDAQQAQHDQAKKDLEDGATMPLDMHSLSEELAKALREAFAKLPQKKQDELRAKAEEYLQDLEDALNKTVQGKMVSPQPMSHADFREDQRQRAESVKQEAKREQERKAAQKKIEEAFAEHTTAYDTLRTGFDEVIDELYGTLEEFFTRERHPKWKKGFASGPRLSLFKAMQFASGAKPEGYREMFERKTMPQRFDYVVSIVVDLSGSMGDSGGAKIHETRNGLVVLSEVLDRLGIPFEIYGFNSTVGNKKLKGRDEDFDETVQEQIVKIITMPEGSTPLASALKSSFGRINAQPAKNNYIIVLTDGQPEEQQKVVSLIKRIMSNDEVVTKLIGVGLGSDTGFVKGLFPNGIGDIPTKELPAMLGDLLLMMIENPDMFSGQKTDDDDADADAEE